MMGVGWFAKLANGTVHMSQFPFGQVGDWIFSGEQTDAFKPVLTLFESAPGRTPRHSAFDAKVRATRV